MNEYDKLNDGHFMYLPFTAGGKTVFIKRALQKMYREFPYGLNESINLSFMLKYFYNGFRRFRIFNTLLCMFVDYLLLLIIINKNKVRVKELLIENKPGIKADIAAFTIVAPLKHFKESNRNRIASTSFRSRYAYKKKAINYYFERNESQAKIAYHKYNRIVDKHSGKLTEKYLDGSIFKL